MQPSPLQRVCPHLVQAVNNPVYPVRSKAQRFSPCGCHLITSPRLHHSAKLRVIHRATFRSSLQAQETGSLSKVSYNISQHTGKAVQGCMHKVKHRSAAWLCKAAYHPCPPTLLLCFFLQCCPCRSSSASASSLLASKSSASAAALLAARLLAGCPSSSSSSDSKRA